MVKRVVAILLCLGAVSFAVAKDEPRKNEPKPAQSIAELQQQLQKILKDTHTPGVSVAIVHKDGPEWVGAVGMANVAAKQPATGDTLFRIGSTSKAFASLSILKLADEGKLSLNDPIRKYVPDLWFKNRWESTDPVRIVNVLEHTTGWDDLHFRDYALDAKGMDLRTALDFGKASRVSRWRPGTRMAYCNTGPAVAAYIVERVTGMRFEDYVQRNFFDPIGMKTASYFPPPAATAVTLYQGDGKTPFPYWNIIYRPAGAINASAKDMAAYVQFYLNRGTVNGVTVIPAADMDRMENPESTWAARDGLQDGYGLSNYWTIADGFVYHGHNGGVNGGLTEMNYLPQDNVGYFFSINSGNGDAFNKISKAIRGYITAKLQRPAVPAAAPLPLEAAQYAGWYEPDAPRNEMTHFLERLAGLSHVAFQNDRMTMRGMSGPASFVPVGGRFFRYLPKDGPPEPVASAVLITPNSDGTFIQAGTVFKRIPAWFAFAEILLTAFVLVSMVSILLYAPVWMIGGLFKRRRRPGERAMRVYPLVAVLSLVGLVVVFILSSADLLTRLGNFSVYSALVWLCTVIFALATLMSLWSAWRASVPETRMAVRWYSTAVSLALLVALLYLGYWGVIGIRTWA
jgi:CubicO group peptidase (beta-lactamase class C family)